MSRAAALPVALASATLAACSGAPEAEYRTVTVDGTVRTADGMPADGTLHFRLYNLWYLDGELRHPLEEIEDFTSKSAGFSHTFEYPLHKGTGLALHAWLDTDGDGVFCTPEYRDDPGGLAWQEATPGETVELDVTLTENCRAAGWFFPPAETADGV